MTAQEEKAISDLKRLANRWPKTLWLFSAEGVLHVMRLGPDGQRVQASDGFMDRSASIEQINIPNDGGEW